MNFKVDIKSNTNFKFPLGVGIIFLLLFCVQIAFAQSPKREMRASWLTTVWRIDWPSVTVPAATGTNESARQAAIQQQKNDLIRILDGLKAANMNAAFFQVRSMCDAMYQSSYEPWSQFVSSVRGANPGYDPLAFAIEEAHKRGIELHAWVNPYRYSSSQTTHGETANDYFHTKPGWLLAYDSFAKILNPGLPEVVMQIKRVVGEIVNNYDVDGIVFDDYFYAYGGTSNTLDAAAQALHKPAAQNVHDWRRENVNRMIAAVYDTIQKVKPHVTFGVSPFGTWTTNATVAAQRGVPLPTGVGNTADMYAQIYCDPVAWLEQGTVDYVSPQLYWTTFSAYPYGRLAPWWSNLANRFGKHFYASHSLTALSSASPAPAQKVIRIENDSLSVNAFSTLEIAALSNKNLSKSMRAPAATSNFTGSEIQLQIGFNRTSDINDAPGSVFYATNKIVNTAGFTSYLAQNTFTHPSLTPAIGWKKAPDQSLVENITVTGQQVSWIYSNSNVLYAVYAVPNANRNDAHVFADSKYLLGVAFSNQFTLPANVGTSTHKIAVSVVDRYKNEFAPRVLGEIAASNSAATLTSPTANSTALIPSIFRWSAVSGADSYVWQVATDAQFNNLVCSRETKQPEFFSGLQTNLNDNTTYFWRVRTRKANAVDVWSGGQRFTTDKFGLTSPANNASGVSITPTISWDFVSSSASYTIEISTAADFIISRQVFRQTVAATSVTVPTGVLLPGTTYFVRVSVADGIVQSTSEIVLFTTLEAIIPVPQLTAPANGASLTGTSIQVCWAQQISNGFRVEYARDPLFPARGTTLKNIDANTFCTTLDNLAAATYHIRVRALTNNGTTEPSATIQVVLSTSTSVKENELSSLKTLIRSNSSSASLVLISDQTFDAKLQLFSLSGSEIFRIDTPIHAGENTFVLPNLQVSKGAYILSVQSTNNSVSYKLIH